MNKPSTRIEVTIDKQIRGNTINPRDRIKNNPLTIINPNSINQRYSDKKVTNKVMTSKQIIPEFVGIRKNLIRKIHIKVYNNKLTNK